MRALVSQSLVQPVFGDTTPGVGGACSLRFPSLEIAQSGLLLPLPNKLDYCYTLGAESFSWQVPLIPP